MNSYKIVVQYNGHDYIGWQVQPNGQTIQGTLNHFLGKICKSDQVKTIGSGRTDSGVHALGQVVKIEMPLKIEPIALKKALNSLLPDVIRILEVQDCPDNFHPIFSAKKKEYLYAFTLDKMRSPFIGQLVARYPHKDFDLEMVKKGCEAFVGRHDFCNYFCTGTPVKTTVREIFNCELESHYSNEFFTHFSKEILLLRFEGSGFLKQMVRLMVGALWSLGAGKITLQDIENSLAIPLEKKLSAVAPPQGLYLHKVTY